MRRYFTKSSQLDEELAAHLISEKAYSLHNINMLDPLINRIGDARIVMLGEASHGTHEYYAWRALISQKLIREKGFSFIAVEGDWPDCYRINRYVKNYADAGDTAFNVLTDFTRWPTWMWANWEVIALTNWLANYNKKQPHGREVGFYGLDVYSLWESLESIIDYLRKTDPGALKIAEEAFRCFEPYHGEGQNYARASMLVPELCETEVVDLLSEIRHKLPIFNSDHEHVFSTEQNAIVAVNAEKYYRAMVAGGPHSWNLRDRHMNETLERLLHFHGPGSKAIIWAHNTHIGDARATDMVDEGMLNIGELARLNHQEQGVVLVGFGSYSGSVIAGRSWGAEMRRVNMPEAREGSWEHLCHTAAESNKLLIMDDFTDDVFMENHIPHRAVGVVYNPEYERYGNYVPTILPLRYDAFIYLDHTHALHPLHILPHGKQVPDTYPFGV